MLTHLLGVCLKFISSHTYIQLTFLYKKNELRQFYVHMVLLHFAGLIQPVHGIRLEIWLRWHPQLQLSLANSLNIFCFCSLYGVDIIFKSKQYPRSYLSPRGNCLGSCPTTCINETNKFASHMEAAGFEPPKEHPN